MADNVKAINFYLSHKFFILELLKDYYLIDDKSHDALVLRNVFSGKKQTRSLIRISLALLRNAIAFVRLYLLSCLPYIAFVFNRGSTISHGPEMA